MAFANRLPRPFLLVAALALSAGCATAARKNTPPEWVSRGSGAFKNAQGVPAFCGVGIAQGVHNRSLADEEAVKQGRAEVVKILNSYAAVLAKGYISSLGSWGTMKSLEEQAVSQTQKALADSPLTNAVPMAHWTDPVDGAAFSLVEMDLAVVKKTSLESRDFDAKMREYAQANAEKAFDELSLGKPTQ